MKATLATYWRKMASGATTGTAGHLAVGLLIPAALVYGMIQMVRSWCYSAGFCKSHKLPKPTVSIGNISVGGTGKTPVAAWLASELITRGYRVAVLSRGYGGALEGTCAIVSDGATITLSPQECGDEPYLLASSVPGLIVVIGSDRYRAGCLALEQFQPDLFLLDDGFQHLKLQRNLDIVLLDWRNPFGTGWCLPAGLLREPLTALKRADLIIRTRCDHDDGVSTVAGIPCYNAGHEFGEAVPLAGGTALSLAAFVGKPVVAFAGIAEPERFFSGLRGLGVNLVETVALPDHVRYDNSTVARIVAVIQNSGAIMAFTTEKDGVKLQQDKKCQVLPICSIALRLVIDKPDAVISKVTKLLQKQG